MAKLNEELDNSIKIDSDGKVYYPWQVVYKVNKRKKQKEIEIEEEIQPLKAYVKSISPSGNMTIAFTKQIIPPPLKVEIIEEKPQANLTEANR